MPARSPAGSLHSLHGLWHDGRVPSPPTITPVLVAELLVEGERWPVYVHVIDHPDARVLVDTGMTELHPAVADMDPRLLPLSEQASTSPASTSSSTRTCTSTTAAATTSSPARPIYVQRQELDDARSEDDYTIREWVDAPGVQYVPVDGELELLPGLRLVPAPGHTRGLQVVVVETGGRPLVVGGDVAVRFGELDEPRTEGQLRVRALDPELVWLAHEHEPWRGPCARRVGSARGAGDANAALHHRPAEDVIRAPHEVTRRPSRREQAPAASPSRSRWRERRPAGAVSVKGEGRVGATTGQLHARPATSARKDRAARHSAGRRS